MAKVRIKLDKGQIIQLMHSPPIVNELTKQAGIFAAAAGPEYEVRQWQRKTKAVVNVVDPRPFALFREAVTGTLARTVARLTK